MVSFVSCTPFLTFLLGQRVDDHGWDRLRGVGVLGSEDKPIRYTVHSVKSVIFSDDIKNIIQSWLSLTPYDVERSLAFGETEPAMTLKEALSEPFND